MDRKIFALRAPKGLGLRPPGPGDPFSNAHPRHSCGGVATQRLRRWSELDLSFGMEEYDFSRVLGCAALKLTMTIHPGAKAPALWVATPPPE